MRQRLLLLIVALVASAAPTGSAHHPFATYDLDREISVTGEIVRAIYAEPHSFLHIREAGDDRKSVWVGELKGVSALRARGLTPRTLLAGDRVTLRGHPGRVAADRRLWLISLTRERDNWTWSAP